MCGIAGIIAPEAKRYSVHLKRMTDSIANRGPDGSGEHFFGNCALGHRRLSIVDLNTGQQPMLSPDGKNGITFNGEIYGFREIRAVLAGYSFRTTSDTEVVLALYREYGVNFLTRLPGMFAFALWNDEQHELVCARDRFGEKPFYYAFGEQGEFVFASEIKAIIASGLVRPVLNRSAVGHYLKHLYVHPLQTIYHNIHSLPPAHSLHFANNRLTVTPYWQLPATDERIGLDEAAERLRELFDRAVARQLVADVPVGAFLSGGLDSSTIVAAASRLAPRLKTFSFAFEGLSELPFARQVADLYHTEHLELVDGGSDIADLLLTMQSVYDEPFADSSNIPTYLLSCLARQHVKVVLTGDGGDELFGGYAWYRPLLNFDLQADHHQLLTNLLRIALKMDDMIGGALPAEWRDRIIGRKLSQNYPSLESAHAGQQAFFQDAVIKQLGFIPPVTRQGVAGGAITTVDAAMRIDISNYMPGDILLKIDRASMAHGLELRAPFLDVDLASFCISLPYSLKITNGEDKVVLRRAFAAAWPAEIRSRRKQGFGAPVERWMQRQSMRAIKAAYLDDPKQKLYSLMPFAETRKISAQNDYQTWILLVLAIWLDRHPFELA